MKLNKILLVSIILLFIFTIGAVSAADENITDTTEEVLSAEPVDELEVSQGDFTELSSLVKNTSDQGTLYLEKDYVQDGYFARIPIRNAITIDGQGHTITKKNSYNLNIFDVDGKAVFKNINFIGTTTGVLYKVKANGVSFNNCSFINCSGGEGGILYHGNAYNCTFVNCQGPSLTGNNAYDCSFVNCSKLCIDRGKAYRCSFINCHSNNRAGAIVGNLASPGYAKDCYFENCSSEDGGGAIFSGTATNCTFVDCEPYHVLFSVYATNEYSPMSSIPYGKVVVIRVDADRKAPGYLYITVGSETKKVSLSSSYSTSFGVLDAGSYNVKVTYEGSGDYKAQNLTTSFKVVKSNIIGYISPYYPNYIQNNTEASYTGGTLEIRISLPSSKIEDYLNVTVNGVTQKVSTYGTDYLKVNAGILDPGKCNIKVSHSGNNNVKAQTITYTFKVINGVPIKNIGVAPWSDSNLKEVNFDGGKSNLLIYLKSSNVPGNIHVTVNGVKQKVPSAGSSKLTIPLGVLTLGSYDIKVSYAGSAYFNPQNMTYSFKVVKGDPINRITVLPWYISNGDEVKHNSKNATLDILMNSNHVSGYVHVKVNGATQKIKAAGSTLTVNLGVLKEGSYDIVVSYAGSAGFNAQNKTLSFRIVKGTPISTGDITPKPVMYGDDAIINVKMSNNQINGNVWFNIKNENNKIILTDKIHIENGVATRTVSNLAIGNYNLHLYYAGNANYNAQIIDKAFEVVKGTPISSVEVSNNNVGENLTIKVKVNNVNGNVWFTISDENGTKIFTDKIHIEDGWAIASIPNLNAGKYNLHVYYAGNAYYNAQTIKTSFNVNKISPGLSVAKTTVDGKTVLTASIAEDARGNVNFEVNGSTYKAQIVKGVATLTLPDMAPGTYILKSSYGGNYKYLAETKTRSITIK